MGKRLKQFKLQFLLIAILIAGIVVVFSQLSDDEPENARNLGGLVTDFSTPGQVEGVETYDIVQPREYNQPLRLAVADMTLSILPLGARAATYEQVESKENTIRYNDVYTNTDIEQTRETTKLKEDIILKAPGHPAEFRYQLNLEDFDIEKDGEGNFHFYPKGKVDELNKIFTIPAPFMIDADGNKSQISDVEMKIDGDVLVFTPSQAWLDSHQYPIILDPTVEIHVINIQSYPVVGGEWEVDFTTVGQADLKIEAMTHDEYTTVFDKDIEFISLVCGAEERVPIRDGNSYIYENWSCDELAMFKVKVLKGGEHHLQFQFADQIADAYNATFEAANATGGSLSTTVNIGTADTNRLVAVFAGSENDSGISLAGVTVDGKSCVSVAQAYNTNGVGNRTELWYCDESDLGSSNGTVTVAITGSGLTASYWAVHAIVYTGVSQSGPKDNGIDESSVTPTDTTSISGIDVSAGGVVVMGAHNGSGGISVSSYTSPLTERTTADPNSADGVTASGVESSAQTSKTYTATWASAPNRSSGVVASWDNFASSPTITDIIDSPDPVSQGSSVSFDIDWNDAEGDTIKAKLCKTNGLTSQNCDGGYWASSTVFTPDDPETLFYHTTDSDITEIEWYGYVCDVNGGCSSATSGTTTITALTPSGIKLRSGTIKLRSGTFKINYDDITNFIFVGLAIPWIVLGRRKS